MPDSSPHTTPRYETGDQCIVCRHWFWESDGGWHSLVPIQYADTPELRQMVYCPAHLSADPPTEADIARGHELAEEHGW